MQPNNEPGEGQEAQQNVTLQLVAADTQMVKGKPYSADTRQRPCRLWRTAIALSIEP